MPGTEHGDIEIAADNGLEEYVVDKHRALTTGQSLPCGIYGLGSRTSECIVRGHDEAICRIAAGLGDE